MKTVANEEETLLATSADDEISVLYWGVSVTFIFALYDDVNGGNDKQLH